MKSVLYFFSDLGGSLVGGGFYRRALDYSTGRGWRFLLTLLFIVAAIHTIYYMGILSGYYDRFVDLFESNDFSVVFDNGVIANMPADPKFIPYEGDTIVVWEWLREWSDVDSLHELHPDISIYVGPRGVFSAGGAAPYRRLFPGDLTVTIDAAYLRNLKTGYSWLVYLFSFILIYAVGIVWALVVMLIFIIPILALKFSRIGMRFGDLWKLGLFLTSYHFVLLTLVTILNIDIPYIWIYNFPLYILIILLLVNIAPEDLKPQKQA
jgi:hypothetical protein